MEKIRAGYEGHVKIALMLGGLRPWTTEAMSPKMRDEILHHWHEVHRLTGQSFSFEGALPEGFIYDTEPACRAVITLAELLPDKTFAYFKSIQSAFYMEQVDVTRSDNLAELASQQGLAEVQFLTRFDSEETRQKTRQHFVGTQQAGVRGFPTLVLQDGSEFEFISRGYQPYDALSTRIEAWLEHHSA